MTRPRAPEVRDCANTLTGRVSDPPQIFRTAVGRWPCFAGILQVG